MPRLSLRLTKSPLDPSAEYKPTRRQMIGMHFHRGTEKRDFLLSKRTKGLKTGRSSVKQHRRPPLLGPFAVAQVGAARIKDREAGALSVPTLTRSARSPLFLQSG